jgi:protein TonB
VKTLDVPPIYPPEAQAARVQGIVIAEIRIGEDGRVADARVLRSIPLLDTAALDAVRQWHTPTMLNGAPVPVLMTVTVNFTLPPQFDVRRRSPAAPQPRRSALPGEVGLDHAMADRPSFLRRHAGLALILVLAALVRVWGLDFGLPTRWRVRTRMRRCRSRPLLQAIDESAFLRLAVVVHVR